MFSIYILLDPNKGTSGKDKSIGRYSNGNNAESFGYAFLFLIFPPDFGGKFTHSLVYGIETWGSLIRSLRLFFCS